jgi:hypothetical protein
MPRLSYRATNFPASYGVSLIGQHDLTFTWPELVWAAISVGRKELLHLLRYGAFSAFEIVYRAAILFANLRETPDDAITRSEAYDGLDPSEKGAVSYFMGLTGTKLIADRLLAVPWLMHLDVYRQELQPVLQGATKPDLVGRNTAGEWIAIESKGRTHGYDQRAMNRAKEQVEGLLSISGVTPVLRVALLAHFDGGLLQCAVDDPEKTKKRTKPIDLPLSEHRLLEGYYRPFREWLRSVPNARDEIIGQQKFRLADMPEVNISVGLREDILLGEIVAQPQVAFGGRFSEEHQYVGRDGVIVRVGDLWSEENMRREPQERSQNAA